MLAAGATGALADRYSWSGFYIGLHAGYGWGDSDTTIDTLSFWGPVGATASTSPEGGIAGGHIGWQQQFGKWVGGIEVTGSGSAIGGSATSPSFPATDVWQTDIKSLVTATVRLGYVWEPRLLTYIKGGYAGAEVEATYDFVGLPALKTRGSGWFNGWTVGAGFDYALTSAVSVGLEYNYVKLDSDTILATSPVAALNTLTSVDIDAIHTATARLTVKIGP